ncbi:MULTISPECIES: hypothetical protein [unclassified Streptomyces]|uniref:hypothetical protein n=1 Tax=unclassified Streptomyces TaxID=2593676 RepID=UPI002B1E1744|nr:MULTISPECIES: hypothetical protein [unclassified Streptomyces]
MRTRVLITFKVVGNDVTITFAAEAGRLQPNAFEPVVAHCLFDLTQLHAGCLTLAERCALGITTDRDHLRATVENTIGNVTALNPHIGYAQASAAAQETLVTGRAVADIVLAQGLLTQADLDNILRPQSLARSGSRNSRCQREAGSDGTTHLSRLSRRRRSHQRLAVSAHGRRRRSPYR